jgi:hypothetical protein
MMSRFFQLDRLVVEGQASGRQKGGRGDIARLKDTGSATPIMLIYLLTLV